MPGVISLHQEPPPGQQISRVEGKAITTHLFEEKCPAPGARQYVPNRIYAVPKVSIYIPAYNAAKYIQAAVDSALNQTYTDLEVCICDDGSTDNTLQVLQENYSNDQRVRWVSQPNGGISKASNTAVRLCRGTYIGQLDADDLLKPNALAITVPILDNHNVGYVYSKHEIIDADGNYIREGYSSPFSREWLLVSCIASSFRLFRKRDFIRCGGCDTTLDAAVDYDLALRMAETCDFYFVPEVLYSYRWHGQNTSIVKRKQQELNHVLCINKALKRMGLDEQWKVVAGEIDIRSVKFINNKNYYLSLDNHNVEEDVVFITTTLYSKWLEYNKKIISILFPNNQHLIIDGRKNWPYAWFYWIEELKKVKAKKFVCIDEDCFITSKPEVLRLLKKLDDEKYSLAGISDAYSYRRKFNPVAINPFFMAGNVSHILSLNFTLEGLKFYYKSNGVSNSRGIIYNESKHRKDFIYPHKKLFDEENCSYEKEPFYMFYWMLKEQNRKFYYLFPRFNPKFGSTDPSIDENSESIGIHMWYAREWNSDNIISGMPNRKRYELIEEHLIEMGYIINH